MAVIPTPLPPDSTYTSCYCEENIYLLCKTLLEDEELGKLWEPYVVFISNTSKMVGIVFWEGSPSLIPTGSTLAAEASTLCRCSCSLGLSCYTCAPTSRFRRESRGDEGTIVQLGV